MNNQPAIRVLVGLDLTEMDHELVRYTGLLRQWLPVASVTFLHSIKVAELPPDLRAPEKLRQIAARIEARIRDQASAAGAPAQYDVLVAMEEFSELAFMNIVKKQQVNLVLLGNKQTLEGSGGLNQKLARMLPAAVLLVPEQAKSIPSRIVQAIDFSRYTAAVVRWGQFVSSGSQAPALLPVCVHRMSYHAFPVFSDEEIEAAFTAEAAEKARKWKSQFPSSPPLEMVPSRNRSVASTLLVFARDRRADMIILGVKGSTSLTNLFMGSVANELLQRENVPALLLVKP